jgi:hypothetical protein
VDALAQPNAPRTASGVDARGSGRIRLSGVVSSATFKNVNRNDARAALIVLFDSLAQQQGFLPDSKVEIVDTVAEIRDRFQNGSPGVATLAITDYLELESSHLLVPVLCVVDDVNLNLAREMNPQLEKLTVLARSLPVIESVIAMSASPAPYQNALTDALLKLHEDPRGRQLLMVFKTDRLVRIQPGYLDSARELWKDYHRLPGSPQHVPTDRGKEGH